MTALLTDTPRPGDVLATGEPSCFANDRSPDGPCEGSVLMLCHRPSDHEGDHYDAWDETSWRIEEQPHA